MTSRLLPVAVIDESTRDKASESLTRLSLAIAPVVRVAKGVVAYGDIADAGLLIEYQGIPVLVEHQKGETRSGVSPDGTSWSTTMQVPYGFIPETISTDGEEIDVYVGADPNAPYAYIVHQITKEGAHDELKLMFGFEDPGEAVRCYLAHVPAWAFGGISAVPISLLKGMLRIDPNEVHKTWKSAELSPDVVRRIWVNELRSRDELPLSDVEMDTPTPGPSYTSLIREAVLASLAYLFDWDLSSVEQPMVVGAQHNNVLLRIAAAVFPGLNVANIVRGLSPAANRAAVQELTANGSTEAGGGGVSPVGSGAPLHLLGMKGVSADIAASLGAGTNSGVVIEGGPTVLAGHGELAGGLGWVDLLVRQLAGVAAEFSGPKLVNPTAEDVSSALQALLFGDGHVQQFSKKAWNTSYINDLSDDAFLHIESGGQKDVDGKTTPRSLRHFPYKDKNGKVDEPHLRNAIAQAPKSNLPASVIEDVQARGRKLLEEQKKGDETPSGTPTSLNPTQASSAPVEKDAVTVDSIGAGGKLLPTQNPGGIEIIGKGVPEKYKDIDFSVPKAVKDNLKRGLDLNEEGHSGDGLKPETVAWARRMVNGEDISPEKVRAMRAWLARHEVDRKPDWAAEKTPGYVAWMLWGGDDAVGWSNKLVEQMDSRDSKKTEKADISEHTISITATPDAVMAITKILQTMMYMGMVGTSRTLFVESTHPGGPAPIVGFDGDGAARIKSVKIDGNELTASKENLDVLEERQAARHAEEKAEKKASPTITTDESTKHLPPTEKLGDVWAQKDGSTTAERVCPECSNTMRYDAGPDAFVCGECEFVLPSVGHGSDRPDVIPPANEGNLVGGEVPVVSKDNTSDPSALPPPKESGSYGVVSMFTAKLCALGHDHQVAKERAVLLAGDVAKGAQWTRQMKALDNVREWWAPTAYIGQTIPLDEAPPELAQAVTKLPLTETYPNPDDVGGWLGVIEPQSEEWIAFVAVDGRTLVWDQREPEGGVIGMPYYTYRLDLATMPISESIKKGFTPVKKFRVNMIGHSTETNNAPIMKASGMLIPGKRLVYGVVLEPNPCDGQGDSQGHTYTEDDIEAACHYYANFRMLNAVHKGAPIDPAEARVVENFIAPCDFQLGTQIVKKGSWVMVAQVLSDAIWANIENGKWQAWSVEGFSRTEPINTDKFTLRQMQCTRCTAQWKTPLEKGKTPPLTVACPRCSHANSTLFN